MTEKHSPLLPCPFCGKPPILDEHAESAPGEDDSFCVIRCSTCGISKEWNYKSNASRWWNTRTASAEPVALTDRQLWEMGCLTRAQLVSWTDGDLVKHIAGIRKTLKLLFEWIDAHAAPDAEIVAALADARDAFETIRLILINHLNEPERSAFWKAVQSRDAAAAALAKAKGGSQPEKPAPALPTREEIDANWQAQTGFPSE